jgi:hypothetical protein
VSGGADVAGGVVGADVEGAGDVAAVDGGADVTGLFTADGLPLGVGVVPDVAATAA